MAVRGGIAYRKEALIRSAQSESLDDLLQVTAPHERIFRRALLVLLFGLAVWFALAV